MFAQQCDFLFNALSGVVLFLILEFLGEMEKIISILSKCYPVVGTCAEGFEEGRKHSERAQECLKSHSWDLFRILLVSDKISNCV